MASSGYRWTLDEFILRAELADGSLRELVAEGSVDRAFFEDILDRYGAEDVVVYDSDYFEVGSADVQQAGLTPGVKSELLTLALRLAQSNAFIANEALIIVVVDHDYDGLPDREFQGCVLVTAYYSIENYALARRTMDGFVRRVLVREVRPRGAGGSEPRGRRGCTGRQLLDGVLPGAIDMAAVRLVLRGADPPLRPLDSWSDYFAVSSEGKVEGRSADLMQATLVRARREIEGLEERFRAARANVAAAPRTYVRGRDFVRLLHKVLKSSWGRRVSSINFSQVDEPTVATWMLASVHSADIDEEPLFIVLRDVFGAQDAEAA